MRLLQIDDTELGYLIEKKRDHIGNKKWSVVNIIAGAALVITAFSSNFEFSIIPGVYFQVALVLLGVIEIILEIRLIIADIRHPYKKGESLGGYKKA